MITVLYFHQFSVRSQAFKLELRVDVKGTIQKTGDLSIELNGMDVNMSQFPPRVPNGILNGMSLQTLLRLFQVPCSSYMGVGFRM